MNSQEGINGAADLRAIALVLAELRKRAAASGQAAIGSDAATAAAYAMVAYHLHQAELQAAALAGHLDVEPPAERQD